MATTDKQQETVTSNEVFESAKPKIAVLDEISSFHETLETERVHRVLVKWRKRKRDEEVSAGRTILEKILRTLRDEVDSRKERAGLWDQALIAELKTDRARLELHSRAAASALTPEKQTQVVQAVASALNIEISSEELGKMLSKTTTAPDASASELTRSMPPTPPADRHSPVMPHNMRPPDVDTHIREPSPRRPPVMSSPPSRPPVGTRMSSLPPRPSSRAGSSGGYTTYSQVPRPQASSDKTTSPTRTEMADHYTPTPPNKKQRTDGPSALKTSSPEKRPTRPVRNIRLSD